MNSCMKKQRIRNRKDRKLYVTRENWKDKTMKIKQLSTENMSKKEKQKNGSNRKLMLLMEGSFMALKDEGTMKRRKLQKSRCYR